MKIQLLLVLLFGSHVLFSQHRGITPLVGKAPSGTERRLALVIGNKDYNPSVGELINPINDADDVADALRKLGFEVTKVTNVDYRGFLTAITEFNRKLTNSDVAFFYFSGHGVSYERENYLLPIDTDIKCLSEIEVQGIPLNRILGGISAQKVKNSFVVLDACRNLPNRKKCDGNKGGFDNIGLVKPTNNPRGSLVVYATEEGSTADDNPKSRNGLFTGALLHYLTVPNLTIKAILDNASLEVEDQSKGVQLPVRYDRIYGDFYFVISDNVATRSGEVIVSPQNGAVKDLSFGPSMVFVEGGTFSMGSNEGYDDEKPVHQVSVSDYWMGQTEVTVGDYLVFCEATNSHYPEWLESGNVFHIETGTDKYYADKGYSRSSRDLPIVGVSWDDAVAYCAWLSKKTGLSYRLPTEAEWEFASRGGTISKQRVYSGSNDLDVVGWHLDNSGGKPHVVKQKQGNELGLYDMSGNVLEWCNDWYGSYSSAAQQNPEGASSRVSRVLRGGSWFYSPQNSRVASRDYNTPVFRHSFIGFRVLVSQATGNVRLGGK